MLKDASPQSSILLGKLDPAYAAFWNDSVLGLKDESVMASAKGLAGPEEGN